MTAAAGCASDPYRDHTRLPTEEVNEAIVATLARMLADSPNYCLRVFGRRPTRGLSALLEDLGHDVGRCRKGGIVYRIPRVQRRPDGAIAVDYFEDGGPLNTRGSRQILRRTSNGVLEHVDVELLWVSM